MPFRLASNSQCFPLLVFQAGISSMGHLNAICCSYLFIKCLLTGKSASVCQENERSGKLPAPITFQKLSAPDQPRFIAFPTQLDYIEVNPKYHIKSFILPCIFSCWDLPNTSKYPKVAMTPGFHETYQIQLNFPMN